MLRRPLARPRIALDPETVSILTEHRRRWSERTAALGVELSADAFVFSLAPDGSTYLCAGQI